MTDDFVITPVAVFASMHVLLMKCFTVNHFVLYMQTFVLMLRMFPVKTVIHVLYTYIYIYKTVPLCGCVRACVGCMSSFFV